MFGLAVFQASVISCPQKLSNDWNTVDSRYLDFAENKVPVLTWKSNNR